MEAIGQVVVGSPATLTEETSVLKAQLVEEIVGRLTRGASVSKLAADGVLRTQTIARRPDSLHLWS